MAARLSEDFNGDLVRVVLFEPLQGLDDADWLQVIPRDDAVLVPFRDCLADGEPLCGRLHPDKQALLYGPRVDEVQSTALLPLDEAGRVAGGHRTPDRLYHGMGPLVLPPTGEPFSAAPAQV